MGALKTTGLVLLDNKNMHLSSILFSILLFYKNIKAHEPRNLGESRVFDVTSINNAKIGTIKITQGHEGIVIRSNISCLSTGGHGFHIHQTASCLHDTKFKVKCLWLRIMLTRILQQIWSTRRRFTEFDF